MDRAAVHKNAAFKMCPSAWKAGEPVIYVSFSLSQEKISASCFFQSLPVHKKKKHNVGMGCHCYDWIAVTAQSGCVCGKGTLPVPCAVRLESVCPLLMQTLPPTSWVVSVETFNLSALLLPLCIKWG